MRLFRSCLVAETGMENDVSGTFKLETTKYAQRYLTTTQEGTHQCKCKAICSSLSEPYRSSLEVKTA